MPDLQASDSRTSANSWQGLSSNGRRVTYHPETLEEAYESRGSYGAPAWEVEGWVTTYTAIAAGEMDVVSATVGKLTGYPPMGLAEFLRRHPESYRHLLDT